MSSRAYQQAYYQQHRERMRAQQHDYHERNREAIKARKRAYYLRNSEAIRAKERHRYDTDPIYRITKSLRSNACARAQTLERQRNRLEEMRGEV